MNYQEQLAPQPHDYMMHQSQYNQNPHYQMQQHPQAFNNNNNGNFQFNPHSAPFIPQATYVTQGQYEYAPPQQYYYNSNQGQGRGHSRSRGRGRGRGSNRNHGQDFRQSAMSDIPDPNVDEELQFVPRSEQYNRKAQNTGNHRNSGNQGRQRNNRGQGASNYANGSSSRQQKRQKEYPNQYQQLDAAERNKIAALNGASGFSADDGIPEQIPQKAQNSSKPDKPSGGQNKYRGECKSQRGQRSNRGPHRKFNNQGQGKEEDAETQRDSLIEQLSTNSYECMVCCDNIRRDAAVWSCGNCYHVYHLRCLKKWARSSTEPIEGGGEGWRCPACQNVNKQFPSQYRCYCGKVRDPDTSRYEIPHSCGEVCRKPRPHGCTHPCNILCHPGPCPPCLATVTKSCDCGKTKKSVKCGQSSGLKCESKCEKTLNCGQHACPKTCHGGPCEACEDQIQQECYCQKVSRTVRCGTSESFNKAFTCDQVCDRTLDCSNHHCQRPCHPGLCDPCDLSPKVVTRCPCGKVALADIPGEARTKCTDPVPTCEFVCGRKLSCGPKDCPHTCALPCHEGVCGSCDGDTDVTCRCGRLTKELSCLETVKFTAEEPFTCDHRCNKKRSCGKHKCGRLCCVDKDHVCDQVCGRKLSCGLHRCEETCHRNNCPTCWHVSFEELRCYCGQEVLYPPVPCGTKAPECHKPCTKEHACGHVPRHNCNLDERCPPCTELTQKWCMGRHTLRKNTPCHLVDISCGMPCGRQLPCGVHKCQLTCHKGACMSEDASCTQPCPRPRDACPHPCSAPCHGDAPCPRAVCRAEVAVRCECGNRGEKAQCLLGGDDGHFLKMETGMLAMTISNAMDGQSLDLGAMMKEASRRKTRKLECNQECSIKERNKRLALALEIKNPDLSSKLGQPTYTQFLRDYAKQYTTFVASIEKDLSKLVKTAEGSKQAKRSHPFKPMNSNQRRLVHELAEFYGCETQSYDEEPNKNVVATAHRGKCFHPSVSLTSLVQRDLHPKAPMPIPHQAREEDIRSTHLASKQGTSVLGAWGKLRPTAPNSAPAPTKPSPWGGASASGGKKPDGTSSGLKLKSMSVLKKSSADDKKKSEGRTSPVIDYFDMS